jgi:gliding motility-associated-like protein
VGCAPTVLDVKLTKPVFCSSVTYTGSEFTIQPGNIVITSVQGDCTGAIPSASMLHVNLQNPLPYGNYQLFIHNGADGDTFIDTCTNNVAATMIPFVINQTTVAPLVQSVSFDECHPDKVVVNFDKPVMCTSISSPANEFAISPGVWPITNVNYNCNGAGNTTTQITLTLQTSLPAGNFNIAVGTGNDGNTLADTCYAFMANGYTKAFVTTKAPAPKFDSVQFDKCNPAFVKLFYSKPIKCATVSADGSDYTITGPSAVNITAAVTDANCASVAYTHWVMLQFAQPVNVSGNYVVHNKTGIDGNGIIDTCSAVQNIAETIAFDALIKPSATFASLVKFGCKMDTITLSHPGGNGINSWLWTFSDGSTATGQTVTKTFPVSTVSTTVQLKVDNGFCNDVVTKDITLDNAFSAAFTIAPKDTSCINTPIAFTNTSTGKNLQYLWQFGDNTQFAGQTPPSHVYTTSNAYNIKLAVTDPYGCTDVATTVLHIAALPTIDFTGLAAQYCTDKTIALTRTISNNIFTYTWNNGDGVTINSQPRVQFSYPKEGVYTITLSGTDKYCGITQVSKPVNIFAVPKFNLGNDTVLCPAVSLSIGVPFTNGYNYLWNTGASTSQINTDTNTANYSLLIDNNGCKAMDDISVKVLVACLIKVPNAFTPNSDGKNDVLRATSADLAKEFTFKVYNRFGELMFATTNPLEGWNGYYKGVRATAGTYVWQLAYIDPWSNKKIFESGTSILIR